jgi:endonuclease/exonuclease/phosphatase family metal-dependent hydrolase
LDRRYDAARIVEVLRELNADVIALQEVPSLEDSGDFLARVRRSLGVQIAVGPTRSRDGVDYGNALLSRFPIVVSSRLDLAVHVHEPRGAIDATIVVTGRQLRVLSTHLGLRPYERRAQVRRLLAAIDAAAATPVVLMGDVNEWFLWGRPLRWLHADFHPRPAPATFPSRLPIFALDRIWVRPADLLRRISPHRSALSRIASDHLPLVAEIFLPLATQSAGAGKCPPD